MKTLELIKALHWFLFLEKGQVAIYDAQQSHLADVYLINAFKRFRDIEAEHVKNITQKIQELGGDPGEYVEIAGHPIGELLIQYGGHGVGTTLQAIGVDKMLKTNIAVEKRAQKDYFKLIKKVDNTETADLLWHNMLDEELHTYWMENWLKSNYSPINSIL